MRESMKKLGSLLVYCALVVATLAGCGGDGGGNNNAPASAPPSESAPAPAANNNQQPSDAPTQSFSGELRVTAQAWMFNRYDFELIKKNFEANHPGVTIVYNRVDTADVTTNMLQWSQGRTDCDIAIGGSREHAVQYAARDFIVEFDDSNFYDNDVKREDFLDGFAELGNIEGHQFMIPITGEVMYIVLNTALMKAAGLGDEDGKIPPAKTWDELYEYAKAATIVENGRVVQTGLSIDWGANFMLYSYLSCLQGIKGNFYEADGKTIDFTSTQSAELLNMWRKLVVDGYSPTDTFADLDSGRSNFRAGKVAMHITAASRWVEAGAFVGSNNVSVMPLPGTDVHGSLVYIHGAVVPKASDQQELAMQFIKEALLDKEFHAYGLNVNGKMSPLHSHYETLYAKQWPEVLEATARSVTTPLYKDFSKLDSAVITEIQNFLIGQQTLEQTQSSLSSLISSLDLTTGLR